MKYSQVKCNIFRSITIVTNIYFWNNLLEQRFIIDKVLQTLCQFSSHYISPLLFCNPEFGSQSSASIFILYRYAKRLALQVISFRLEGPVAPSRMLIACLVCYWLNSTFSFCEETVYKQKPYCQGLAMNVAIQ